MANFQRLAVNAARRYGIPTNLFLRLVKVESGFQPQIVSSAGAIGLTQLMPGTARGLGVDPWNPQQNLDGGAKYLKAMKDKFGTWQLALAAYNAGAGAVEEHGGIPPYPETQHYVSMIMGGLKLAQSAPTSTSTSPMVTEPSVSRPDLSSTVLGNLTSSPEEALSNLTMAVAGAGGPSEVTHTSTPVGGGGGKGVSGIAQTAMKFIGTPYVWGGSSPNGFDCSGLLQYAAAKNGIHIKRTTYDQWDEGTPVSENHLEAGDAVFFVGSDGSRKSPGHVGIYIGHGQFIEAPHTGATVRVSKLAGRTDYVGARRY